MIKLKCTYCDHLNEVNSEYLTFCSNCNRKLKNSFREWKNINPGKTFDDYKKTVCIDEELVRKKEQVYTRQNKKRNIRLIIILSVVGILLGSVFTLFHFKKDDFINNLISLTNTSDEILEKEWVKKVYPDLNFYIETPYELDTFAFPIPDELKNVLLNYTSYKAEKDMGAFIILVMHMQFPTQIPLDFENAVQGSINTIKQQPGVSDYTHTTEPYSLSGTEAKIITGKLKKYGIRFTYKQLLFLKDSGLSQIMVMYHQDDKNAEKASNRIFNSIKLL